MATEVVDKSVQLILFEAIETALADLKTAETIHSIEIFNSQTDFENQERPRLYPYVAVNIAVEWKGNKANNNKGYITSLSQPEQSGMALVTVYTIFESLQTETLAFKASEPIRHCVHRAINLIQDGNYFTQLQRINSVMDTSHDRVFTFDSQYACQLTEAALKDDTKVIATNVDPVLTRNLIIDNDIVRTAGEIP